MKKLVAVTLALSCLLVLFGCSAQTKENISTKPKASTSANKLLSSNDSAKVTSDVSLSDASADNEESLYKMYADMASLPAVNSKPQKIFKSGDRILTIEDSIDNNLENIVYQDFFYEVSGDFKKELALIGEDEPLRISNQNNEKLFKNGFYMKEYTIHKLTTLTADDVKKASDATKQDFLKKINAYKLKQYAVVKVDVSKIHSKNYVPQIDNGRYIQYYLLATKTDSKDFKIYDVYLDDI